MTLVSIEIVGTRNPVHLKAPSFLNSWTVQRKHKTLGFMRALKMTHLVLLFVGLLHGTHSEAEPAKAGLVFPHKRDRLQ